MNSTNEVESYLPYPFFKHTNDEVLADDVEVIDEEGEKEEVEEDTSTNPVPTARKLPRANRRDLFLCKTQEPIKYTRTIVCARVVSICLWLTYYYRIKEETC